MTSYQSIVTCPGHTIFSKGRYWVSYDFYISALTYLLHLSKPHYFYFDHKMQKINVSIYSYSVASNQFSKNVCEETKKMRELPYPASSCLPLNITSSQVLAPCHFALQTEQNWSPHCKHTKQQ